MIALPPLVLDVLPVTGLLDLPTEATVVAASPEVAGAVRGLGRPVEVAAVERLDDDSADALLLLAGELSGAGEHAEGLIAACGRALRPGGLLVAAARSAAVWWRRQPPDRVFTADQLAGALGHAGFDVTQRVAPGAARRVAGNPPGFEPDADRLPGLLDAADWVVAAARLGRDQAGRSTTFFGSLPRKIVAAAVIVRDAEQRLLTVFDSFKQHWTIPGGVVDADEDPLAGAVREAWEEAGVRVRAGALLGVFSHSWPDRLLFVYDAAPVGAARPSPRHAHEITAAEWIPLPQALASLNARTAGQVRRCLDTPGRTWRD